MTQRMAGPDWRPGEEGGREGLNHLSLVHGSQPLQVDSTDKQTINNYREITASAVAIDCILHPEKLNENLKLIQDLSYFGLRPGQAINHIFFNFPEKS